MLFLGKTLSICLLIYSWFALKEGDWGSSTVSTLIHSDFFPLVGYRWGGYPMMLWDSLPIVRLRTQVCQSSRWWQTGKTYLVCEQDTGSIVYRFFNDCVTMEIRETDNSPPSRLLGCFPIMADFSSRERRHLEFSIRLLIGWNLWRPSWIWRIIEYIVL